VQQFHLAAIEAQLWPLMQLACPSTSIEECTLRLLSITAVDCQLPENNYTLFSIQGKNWLTIAQKSTQTVTLDFFSLHGLFLKSYSRPEVTLQVTLQVLLFVYFFCGITSYSRSGETPKSKVYKLYTLPVTCPTESKNWRMQKFHTTNLKSISIIDKTHFELNCTD